MKQGGELIYAGPLGNKSNKLIQYFEVDFDSLFLYNNELGK